MSVICSPIALSVNYSQPPHGLMTVTALAMFCHCVYCFANWTSL